MKTNKIVRQIQHEAKSHPAKALVLALLAVVAVCYWTSLAWSWVGDGKDKSVKTCDANTSEAWGTAQPNIDAKAILDAELAKINSAKNTESNAKHAWKQLVEWIEEDPRTAAVEQMPGRADAFETPEKPQIEDQAAEDDSKTENKPVVIEPEVTPRQLEMSLSSTLLGADGGMALIDGKPHRIGQTVTSEKDQRQTPFILSEINSKYVTLKHDDKTYKLFLPEKKISGSIEFTIEK